MRTQDIITKARKWLNNREEVLTRIRSQLPQITQNCEGDFLILDPVTNEYVKCKDAIFSNDFSLSHRQLILGYLRNSDYAFGGSDILRYTGVSY